MNFFYILGTEKTSEKKLEIKKAFPSLPSLEFYNQWKSI